MENMNDVGLVGELAQGRELAKQLQTHLMINGPCPSGTDQAPEVLLQGIVASYEKALSMLNYHRPAEDATQSPAGVVGMYEPQLPGSPQSEDSDQDASSSSKKSRKSIPRWSQQVRVSPGMGLEGPLDDGFSWRKYGQKDILGAKFPRGYYRCTNRNTQGCLATKQVQRSDEDQNIFEITYRGRHTCTQASSHPRPPSSPSQPPLTHQPQQSQPLDHILSTFRAGLRVQTQDCEHNSFHVAASSAPNNDVYLCGSTHFSPTSGLSGHNSFGQYFLSPESDVISNRHDPIISAATSATNSPTVNLEFPFGGVQGLDPNFSFGNSGFFS